MYEVNLHRRRLSKGEKQTAIRFKNALILLIDVYKCIN